MDLVQAATDTATRAALLYLKQNRLQADDAALTACLRSWCKIKLPEALRDAKDAFDAHMPKIAEQTFLLTMAQAGIEAAKEAGFPAALCPV